MMFSRRAALLTKRHFSTAKPLDASKLVTILSTVHKTMPPKETLKFGAVTSDHMIDIDWTKSGGWEAPQLKPYGNFSLDPACSVFHYGLECFEGMKAYLDDNDQIRLFRPDMNMARMNLSMEVLRLPTFDGEQFLECIKKLLVVEKNWIPRGEGYSLYIRPTGISTHINIGVSPPESAKLFVIMSPVGPYYPTGFAPVKLLADPKYVRAWPGGTGHIKCGGNYAMGMKGQMEAMAQGYQQVLWLYGPNHQVTEVGTMNQFFLWKRRDGVIELVTAPLDGTILPGVTRDSMMQLCREYDEFEVNEKYYTITDVVEAIEEGRMIESFGSGTAAIVSPVKAIGWQGKDYEVPVDPETGAGKLTYRLAHDLMAIQYGKKEHPWSVVV